MVKILAIGVIAFLAGSWNIGGISYGLGFDYGTYGVFAIFLLHIFWQQAWQSFVAFALLTGVMYYTNIPLLLKDIMSGNISQIPGAFGLLPGKINQWPSIFVILLLYVPILQKYDFRFPMWLRYGFYPGHMMILFIVHTYFW